MAMNAQLSLFVSLLDAQSRQASPQPPIRVSWSALVNQSQALTLVAETDNTIAVPTGARLLILDLGTTYGLLLKSVAGDGGIELSGDTSGLGLPLVLPLAPGAVIVLENTLEDDQVVRASWL